MAGMVGQTRGYSFYMKGKKTRCATLNYVFTGHVLLDHIGNNNSNVTAS